MTTTSSQPPELGKEYPGPDESAHTEEIVKLFTGMTERKYPPGVRPMRRDAHTKAHGCVKAEFTVLADLPDRARVGLFKRPAIYQAWIRYSSAFSSIASDRDIDVRGPRGIFRSISTLGSSCRFGSSSARPRGIYVMRRLSAYDRTKTRGTCGERRRQHQATTGPEQ